MGMYTGLRFKGVVKEEFRKGFACCALYGDWDLSENPKLRQFGEDVGRSGFIPCGSLAYMPDEWEKDYVDENGNKHPEYEQDIGRPIEEVYFLRQTPTDGFDRTWNEETGYWTFQCSLKNYESEIEAFFELLPYFIESVEHCEYFYEEDEWSYRYELIDGKMVMTSDRFIQYYDF